MTPDVQTIAANSTIQETAALMNEFFIGMVPVMEDGVPIGVVTDRDLAIRALNDGLDPTRTTVRQVMTPEVLFMYEDDDLDAAIELMSEKKVSRLVVKSKSGAMVGILSAADIAVMTSHEKIGELMQVLGCTYWKKHIATVGSRQ
jgi:CBS domain-containing protein